MRRVGGFRDFSTYPKRFNSEVSLNESWRQYYEVDGDAVGRGGSGKVFRIRPKCTNILHERKSSVPANLSGGEFGPNAILINEVPDDKPLAVKIIRRFRCGRDSIDRIRNEIDLITALQPQKGNIPGAAAPLLISVHEDLTQVAIVMEFAIGGSLFDLCSSKALPCPTLPSSDNTSKTETCLQPRLPESYASSVLLRITDALAFMHEKANIVHLDIKAENILLREPYPSPDVFITDFGLASVLTKSKPHKELAGTPDYTAPEVISYDPVSFATDMWSVGVLAYFLLTGVSPFLAESKALTLSNITQMKIDYPPHLFQSVSSSALDFIRSLIKRDPRARLSASACTKHQWLLPPQQKVKEDEEDEEEEEENVETALEVTGTGGSGDESNSSTSSSSSTSSPIRKRPALDDSVAKGQGMVAMAMGMAMAVENCCNAVNPRPFFALEGLPPHHSPNSTGGSHRHHYHHQPRRRSVFASPISPPTTVAEASPVD